MGTVKAVPTVTSDTQAITTTMVDVVRRPASSAKVLWCEHADHGCDGEEQQGDAPSGVRRPPHFPQSLWDELRVHAQRCAGSARPADVKALRGGVPWVPPQLMKFALGLSASLVEQQDFDAAACFAQADGLQVLHAAATRELFELLFVGNGRFPLGYGRELPESLLVSDNPKRLLVHDGLIPGEESQEVSEQQAREIYVGVCSKEVQARRYLGPFTVAEAKKLFGRGMVSPGFLLRRSNAVTTKDRLIHNAKGYGACSVNEGIEDDYDIQLDHTRVFQEGLREVLQVPGVRDDPAICIADISKCYRRFGVRFADLGLLGLRADAAADGALPFFDGAHLSLRWFKAGQPLVYFDRCLPFGVSSSVSSCVRVTTFIRDIVREKIATWTPTPMASVFAYIDDFPVVGQRPALERSMRLLRGTLAAVGCPENTAKQIEPSLQAQVLGLEYDLRDETVSLPEGKRAAYLRHFESLLRRAGADPVRFSELQSIMGKVVHAAGVYPNGKVFYQRVRHELIRSRHKKTVRLSESVLDDIRWWRHLLLASPGRSPLCAVPWTDANTHGVFTDASGTGWGCYYDGRYMWGLWSAEVRSLFDRGLVSISDLELLVLNFAVETWGHELSGQRLLLWCDNQASVANVTSRSSKMPLRAALLRRLFVFASIFGFQVASTYIHTKRNEHADALSRGDLTRFFSLPHSHALQEVARPRLEAVGLLFDPTGPLDPSSPQWCPRAPMP